MSDNQPTVRDAKPLFALLLGLILFLFGIAVGYMVGGKSAAAPGGRGYDEGYAAATAELRSRLEETGLTLPEEDLQALESQPIRSISGNILEISGDTLLVEATLPSFDILDEPRRLELTVRATDETRILLQRERSPEEFEAAFEAFNREQEALLQQQAQDPESVDPGELGTIAPPEPFASEEISLSDLEPGQTITITTEADIRQTTMFDASLITFFEAIVPLAPELPAEELPLPPPEPEAEPLP